MAGAWLLVLDLARTSVWNHNCGLWNVPQTVQVHADRTQQNPKQRIHLPFAKAWESFLSFPCYGKKASILPGFQNFAENSLKRLKKREASLV